MNNSSFPGFNSMDQYPVDINLPQEVLNGSVSPQVVDSTIMYLPYTILDPSVHAGSLAGRVTLIDSSGFQYELVSKPFLFGFDPSANTAYNQASASVTLTSQVSPNLTPPLEVQQFSLSIDNPSKKRERTLDEDDQELLPAPNSKRRKANETKLNLQKPRKLHKKLEQNNVPAELFADWSLTKQKVKKVKPYTAKSFAADYNSIYYQAMRYLGSRKGLTAELLFNQVIANCTESDKELKLTCEGAVNFIKDYIGKEFMGVTIQPA